MTIVVWMYPLVVCYVISGAFDVVVNVLNVVVALVVNPEFLHRFFLGGVGNHAVVFTMLNTWLMVVLVVAFTIFIH